ncbi:hypothetical protein [Tautonia sociabilis]|uniref:HEAT repeat domain-containing protein n=1 Tax=Tautonia sociabilis TaxID=2080755 RepID=A0A432MLF9_9BACT|nr:hypothetical protein [Tautonia sociabilis]RUL88120.1 hypothetical protein TsocGM_09285 [Tautonia sociabilis]
MAESLGYEPPLDRLLRLGDLDLGDEWRDYRALGIGPEHLPELIRMATDAELVTLADEEDADEAASWGPPHALRAIAQLGAVEAVGPVLEGLSRLVDLDDLWVEDLGDAMAQIGPGAIPSCAAYLADESRGEHCRIIVSEAIAKIAAAHPDARGTCIEIIAGQLAKHEEGARELNGFLVSALIDLKAVAEAPTIEAAFQAGCVAPAIAGDWPEVRFQLGLGPKPESRRFQENWRTPRLGNPIPARRPDLKTLKRKQKQWKKRKR